MKTSLAPTVESQRLLTLVHEKRPMIHAVMQKYGAVNPRIFGSVVQGTAGPDSDVDILVDEVKAPGLLALAGLTCELEELMQTKVDVVLKDTIKHNRRALILNSKMVKL